MLTRKPSQCQRTRGFSPPCDALLFFAFLSRFDWQFCNCSIQCSNKIDQLKQLLWVILQKKCACQLSPSCQLLQMLPRVSHNIASFAAHLKRDVANTVNSVVQPDGHPYARNQTFNITPTPACDVHVNTSQMLLLWLKAITPIRFSGFCNVQYYHCVHCLSLIKCINSRIKAILQFSV